MTELKPFPVTPKIIKKATERYNDLMMMVGHEYDTIDTRYTEDPDRVGRWTLRDLVSEVYYCLGTYYEQGHCNHDMICKDNEDYDPARWRSETGKLKRFIITYGNMSYKIPLFEGHASSFDDPEYIFPVN